MRTPAISGSVRCIAWFCERRTGGADGQICHQVNAAHLFALRLFGSALDELLPQVPQVATERPRSAARERTQTVGK